MDEKSITRLRRNLLRFDDDALVALANKGLVRRAIKDLGAEQVFTVEETNDAILVHGQDWTVTLPAEGPVSATDTTSASGITRQILAATIFLRDEWASKDADTQNSEDYQESICEAVQDAIAIIVNASPEDLSKWIGKTVVLKAAAQLSETKFEVIDSPELKVIFPDSKTHVILMTDQTAATIKKLLDQFKTNCPAEQHALWVLLGVLAIKHWQGDETVSSLAFHAEISDAIREDRLHVSKRVTTLMRSIAATGITHLSSHVLQRLQTMSVAAEAAVFPRLARLIKSLADEIDLHLQRSAAADRNRLLDLLITINALAEAAQNLQNLDSVSLHGQPRSQYFPEPNLKLYGLGSYGWRTASGFEGVSTIFWDSDHNRFLSAVAARGKDQVMSFSIPYAYHQGIGWSGGMSIDRMCRVQLTLNSAQTNHEGRLSASEKCHAILGEGVIPSEIDFGVRRIENWSELKPIAQSIQRIGLRPVDPRVSYVVIQPDEWGNRWFNELDQNFVWELFDHSGNLLPIVVPWREVDEPTILSLESINLKRDQPSAVLGRIEVIRGVIQIYPFSLFSDGTPKGDHILCPQFDQLRIESRNDSLLRRLRKKYKREKKVETKIGIEQNLSEEMQSNLQSFPTGLRNLLYDLESILTSSFEIGANHLTPAAKLQLRLIHQRFVELSSLPVAEALAPLLDPEVNSQQVLQAAYKVELFKRCLTASRIH